VTPGTAVTVRSDAGASPSRSAREVALIDLLDRLLQGGVAIHGQVMLSVAGIDLVELDLRVLVASVDKVAGR
jgi:Gas vesicle protein